MKKILMTAAAVAALATASLTTTQASAHGFYWGGYHHHHSFNWGGPFYGNGYSYDYSPCFWSPYPYPHKVCRY